MASQERHLRAGPSGAVTHWESRCDRPWRSTFNTWRWDVKKLTLQVEELEQRIAPDGLGNGNPGNNNPPRNNTNNSGNEGTGGKVSTGH